MSAPAKLARNLKNRRRGDPPPDSPRRVLLMLRPDVLTDAKTSGAAVRRAADLSGDDGVVVVQVLRLHGYAWGMPNPGLLPNQRERTAAEARVAGAVAMLKRAGVDCDGEILVTRKDSKGVTRIATRRAVEHVILETTPRSRARVLLEGDLARSLIRRMGSGIDVESVQTPA